jgi:hypothetical protein
MEKADLPAMKIANLGAAIDRGIVQRSDLQNPPVAGGVRRVIMCAPRTAQNSRVTVSALSGRVWVFGAPCV